MKSLNYNEIKADIDFRMKNFETLLTKNQNFENQESILVIENELIVTDIDVSESILNVNNEANISDVENPASVAEVNNDYNNSIEFVKKEDEQPIDTIEEKLIAEQKTEPTTKFELKEIDDPEYKPESFGIIGTIKSYLNLFGN